MPYTSNAGLVTDHPYVNLVTATPLVPEEALSAFTGEDPNGTWTLTVADQFLLDGGILQSWTLSLVTLPEAPVEVTTVFASTDTPIAIPSTGTPVIASSLAIGGVDAYLGDVDVHTSLTHVWNADLQITLQSPAGTIVTVTSQNGRNLDDVFDGTEWDDAADPDGQVPYSNNSGMVTDHPYVNRSRP